MEKYDAEFFDNRENEAKQDANSGQAVIDYNKELFVADHIRTYTGIYFNAFDPDPAKINIVDIAHALSNQCRYGGHLPKFYSVAQHCLYCARIAEPALKLVMLLHDSAEAYLLDIPSPFKARMPDYKAAENNLLTVILKKFGVFNTYMQNKELIKKYDTDALKAEWDYLMMKRPCNNMFFPGYADMVTTPPAQVEEIYLRKFRNYKYIY